MLKDTSPATQCVHSGSIDSPGYGGTVTPIYTATAYDYTQGDKVSYPRYLNTINAQVVADKIAALENAEAGLVFGSGMAAIMTTFFSVLKTGDHAVFQRDLYGGTLHGIDHEFDKFGISYSMVDAANLEEVQAAINPNTKLLYIETPSNPLLKVMDVKAIANLAKTNGLISMIDNTFASPINQNPLDLGIDIVIHSGTKYLSGHSDISCGAVAASSEMVEKIHGSAINFGGHLSTEACYLLERSMKTLAIRVKQQNENAMAIAQYLNGHAQIKQVYYPGLTDHPDHQLASQQMHGFGGMLSFEVAGDPDDFLSRVRLMKPAISLGGVETTISSPIRTSHAKISEEQRQAMGITPGLLRLSVGIESSEDLIKDFEQALG